MLDEGRLVKLPRTEDPRKFFVNDPNRAGGLITNAPKFHGITLKNSICQNSTKSTSGDVKPSRISSNTINFETSSLTKFIKYTSFQLPNCSLPLLPVEDYS